MSELRKPAFDLRSGAVHEDELHAQRCEKVEIVREVEESPVGDDVAAERDYENLPPKRVYVRSHRLEPVDETILARQPLAPRR
jgi:hypothetical protein